MKTKSVLMKRKKKKERVGALYASISTLSLPTLMWYPSHLLLPMLYKRDVPRKPLKFLVKTGTGLLDGCHILKRNLIIVYHIIFFIITNNFLS